MDVTIQFLPTRFSLYVLSHLQSYRLYGTTSHDHPHYQTHLHESDWLVLLLDMPYVNGAHILTRLSKLLSRDLRDLVSVHAYYHNLHYDGCNYPFYRPDFRSYLQSLQTVWNNVTWSSTSDASAWIRLIDVAVRHATCERITCTYSAE